MSRVDGIPALLHIKTKLKSIQQQLLYAGKIQILGGWQVTMVRLPIPSQPMPNGKSCTSFLFQLQPRCGRLAVRIMQDSMLSSVLGEQHKMGTVTSGAVKHENKDGEV